MKYYTVDHATDENRFVRLAWIRGQDIQVEHFLGNVSTYQTVKYAHTIAIRLVDTGYKVEQVAEFLKEYDGVVYQ